MTEDNKTTFTVELYDEEYNVESVNERGARFAAAAEHKESAADAGVSVEEYARDATVVDSDEGSGEEFARRFRELYFGEYENYDKTEDLFDPNVRRRNINLSVTYDLTDFNHVMIRVLDDMFNEPEFEDKAHKEKWQRQVAERLVREHVEDTFDVSASGINAEVVAKRRNSTMSVTVVV